MQRIAVLALVTLLGSTSSAFAFAVNLLESSYSYDLLQHYELRNIDVQPVEVIYTSTESVVESGNQPVSRELTLAPGFTSRVTADPFSVFAFGQSRDINTYGYTWGYGHAFVSSSWLFQPTSNVSSLSVDYSYHPWSACYIVLTDITDGLEVFSGSQLNLLNYYIQNNLGGKWEGSDISSLNLPGEELNITHLFLDNHTYELKMGALAQPSNDGYWSAGIAADLQAAAVPEPCSMLLLGLGLVAIGYVRRMLRG